MGRLDPFHGLERVEGDLRAALGDVDGARASYAMAEPTNSLASFRIARLLEREGRLRDAIGVYASGPAPGEWEEWDRALIDAVERWWEGLPTQERFAAVRESIDDDVPSLRGRRRTPLGTLRETLSTRDARRRSDFAAPSEADPAPFASGVPLRALTERMEATSMASWTRWRTYPAFFKGWIAAAWLSPEPAAATSAVERVFRVWRLSAALVATTLAWAPRVSGQGTFQGLGDLPGGLVSSSAYSLSADGSTVVGQSESTGGSEGFVWRVGTGMVGLGDLPDGDYYSLGTDVSADGSVVVGESRGTSGTEAVRWTWDGALVGLGELSGGSFFSAATRCTGDGSSAFGGSIGSRGYVASSWAASPGAVDLGFPGSNSVVGCTPDAATLVGWRIAGSDTTAFRWSSVGGFEDLGDLPGGLVYGYALRVSADGRVVVGFGHSTSGREGIKWTEAEGMIGLGDLPGGLFESTVYSISPDGALLGGWGYSDSGREAVIWEAGGPIQRAAEFLASKGVDIPVGWTLRNLTGIATSCELVTMTGDASNPAGDLEAWVATYPNDTALALRAGNVGTGTGGPPVDVMFVNGSSGDPVERKVTVTAGEPAQLLIDKAPETGGSRGAYGFWIFDGDLRDCVDIQFKKPSGALFTLGQANGCMPINNTVAPGSCPCPLTIPRGLTSRRLTPAKANLFCLLKRAGQRSPTQMNVRFPEGTFTILSLHQDRNSPSSPGKNIAIGNTVVVVAEP